MDHSFFNGISEHPWPVGEGRAATFMVGTPVRGYSGKIRSFGEGYRSGSATLLKLKNVTVEKFHFLFPS